MMPMESLFISLASFFAGMIDSIVGGGGLILVPALFATYPTASPATLLGTNKCASVWGTSLATYQYSKRVQLAWRALLPAAICALAGSFAGAWSVTQIDPVFIRKLMPFILLVVLIYTLAKKDLGTSHKPHTNKNRERLIACLIGAVIGWYDGFFETGLNPWDIAAGSLIITEAGGLVGNFTGEADFLEQKECLAGTPKIYGQLVPILSKYSKFASAGEKAAVRAADAELL